ncbi:MULTISPECIES: glycosyltransferase family 4 protein [unclassified Paenibacillus]|nr:MULTISPECIES: glycosyltransferase family 4 protein [unclassified Paenibacillus]MBP1155871.1 glycosyltransferase involved in cell wall biosynthesis [Paenibacillus sp. PvP091]MBP1168743.1 glycosyltransferase involved in cell wall biosynthesis [Paenibacillus sp. PvR098]MBP2439771.1 glycosyltransferase involved in cell wall biosynthesis [Paenibacillus sp. PvP052]
MKVAMIGWEYPPSFSGGLGVHCQALVRELTSMAVDIEFYLPTDGKTQFDIPDRMTMHPMVLPNSESSYNARVTWEAVQQFRDWLEAYFTPKGIDIIHAHDWMGIFAAMRISRLHNIPLIWTVHSTEYDRSAGMSLHPGILSIELEALSQANYTIAVSKRTKHTLVKRYQNDSAPIAVIYNGLDAGPFTPMSHRNYLHDEGHILFLGRVTEQKGPGIFLEAARIVLAETDARFVIAGDGELLGILRRRARRWEIDNRVEFTGAVFGAPLYDCYRNAILFVLPAVSEPFGITVLEAMASGIPSIISTTTGAGEIIKHALKVNPNNPQELAQTILVLLKHPRLRQSIGQNSAREARHWTWKRVARETYSLYQQVLIRT